MKNLLILVFTLCSFSIFGQANNAFNDLDSEVKKLSEAYQLDAEQQEKLKLMLVDKSIGMEQLNQMKLDDSKLSKKKFELNQNFHNDLNLMVTDEQKASHKKYMQNERLKMAAKNKAGSSLQMKDVQNNNSLKKN